MPDSTPAHGRLELPDGSAVEVRDGLTIGRVGQCDVPLDDAKVSRRHARLIAEGGVVEIEDLRSSNGTLLNGKPVERRLLRDGDVIRIGRIELHYRAGPAPARSQPEPTAAPVAAAQPKPAIDPLLAGDLFDDELFVDAPVAPPQNAPAPTAPSPKRSAARPAEPHAPPAHSPAPRAAAPRPAAAAPAVAPHQGPGPRPAADAPERQHGVLQFNKRRSRGLLGDDVGQTGGLQKIMLIVTVIGVAIAAGALAMQLAQG